MSKMTFQAGLRSCLGGPNDHNTLEFLKDVYGNFILVIQENDENGKMRSQGVRIERSSGDKHQAETYKLIEDFVKHIHQSHRIMPQHPVYVVKK